MRNRAFGLSILFGFSLVVTACGGSSADIKKVGVVTDVGTLDDKSFNEASWVGAQAGATASTAPRARHRHQGAADYARTSRRSSTRSSSHCDRRIRHGRRDDEGRQGIPEGQVHRRRPGRLRRRDRRPDPTFACKGDRKSSCRTTRAWSSKRSRPATSPASSPPASPSRASSAPSAGSTRSRPSSSYINGYGNGAASVNPNIKSRLPTSRRTSPRPSTTRARASRSPADDRPEGGRHLPGRRPVRPRVHRGGLRARICGIGVDVDQSLSLPRVAKCILTSAEKKLVDASRPRSARSAPGPMRAARSLGRLDHPAGVGLSPFHDYKARHARRSRPRSTRPSPA